MKGLTLCGGLGDAFIVMHESAGYEDLEQLAPGKRARVYIISHNPYVAELFRWHPKASQIDVFASRYFFIEYDDAAKRADSGIPADPIDPNLPRARASVRFWPSPEDHEILNAELPKEPFLAVAPTASGMEIENRNLPMALVVSALALCKVLGIPAVLLGRTYQGPHPQKDPPLRPSGDWIVDLTDRLSVPGTAEVIKRARAVLSCHSCLLLLSWYERKSVFVSVPHSYRKLDFEGPSPFGFGRDYPETVWISHDYNVIKFTEFLHKNFTEKII